MFILRSVVGKLWMTIIGLVAVVLIVLGTFLVPYIGSYFARLENQTGDLKKLATNISSNVANSGAEQNLYDVIGDMLSFHDIRMEILWNDGGELIVGAQQNDQSQQGTSFRTADFFTADELQTVWSGQPIDNQSAKVVKRSNGHYTAVAVPMFSDTNSEVIGIVMLYQSTHTIDATKTYVIKSFIYVSAVGFLMTTVFALFLFYRISQPLLHLKKAADQITMGEYSTRVPIISNDEIGQLAKTFNHMGEQLEQTVTELHHEKEHLASVLRSMTDAVITFDADGIVILANPQGERIMNDWSSIDWSASDSSDQLDVTHIAKPYAHVPQPLQPLLEVVGGEGREVTSKLNVHDGVWSVVMTPIFSYGQVRGAVAVLRDVTEEFRLNKLRTDFVANVSHELRTPLSMLQGYSEALLDDIAGTPDERKELAQVIYEESLRMGRLVRDLLDLARMEAGRMELTFREVNVNSLIKRVYRKFSVLAKEQGINLSSHLPDEEALICCGDEDRLEQVMTNLLDNAFRHTPEGEQISITAKSTKLGDQDGLLIEIADQGRGIPKEDLPFIFERFYKADKARKRGATGGTGLGLAIVKNIVDAHKGTVTVQSKVRQGTIFSIVLPCKID